MSGPLMSENNSSLLTDDAIIVANVRRLSGVAGTTGPGDAQVLAAVRGFVERFEFWYLRVMRQSVADYRNLIIKRINPFIRRIELEGTTAAQTASKLVEDYNARNFVTAGGWALEALAIRVSPVAQKSTAEGIDVQRVDPSSGDYHLYVLKSGLVTRNSDILKSLKQNARRAEKLLRQDGRDTKVHAHYAIVAGKTESSFEDGINRPSSAEFWSHMTGLPEREAIDLVLAIAAEAGRLIRRDASEHIAAMKMVVGDYIASRSDASLCDWEFLARRNMEAPNAWKAEDRERHNRALAVLTTTGYHPQKKAVPKSPDKAAPKAR